METDDGETGIILELKYADDGNLDTACKKALAQINRNRYEEILLDEGVPHILKYGIAFYKKRCRVMAGNLDTACKKALAQINRNRYEEILLDEGVPHILKYGIAFYKKRCRVMADRELPE